METTIKKVEMLVNEINSTHRYSMSRITTLHNEVFNRSDAPKAVASTLIRQKRNLENWLKDQSYKPNI